MSRSKKVGARNGKRAAWVLAAAVAGFALAGLATLAIAKTPKTTVNTAQNSQVHATILVDQHGVTLYQLRPETTKHLLCASQQCFGFWPPLKVSKNAKLTKANAIKGKLGKLHRNGFYQVTLDGRPLYHYSGDNGKKGMANGNNVHLDGGVWHVVKSTAAKGTNTTTGTTSTSTSSTYTYPQY
jgi:predicted lipoprotein with Yx(FWY)xxD motif